MYEIVVYQIHEGRQLWQVPKTKNGSSMWNTIQASRGLVEKGARWKIGNDIALDI